MQIALTRRLEWLLLLCVALSVLTWFYARHMQARWLNVPPAPGTAGAQIMTLGDASMAYRITALLLQHLGDFGGRTVNLKEYDYAPLKGWFLLADRLDPRSDFVPYLAAYYFGAVDDPVKVRPVIEYLRVAGNRPEGEKWRWLMHAVYLARFRAHDLPWAMEMARELAAIPNDRMPALTRQMPAFIASAQGDKETALQIMITLLQTGSDKMQRAEINFTLDYICNRILDEREAKDHPLCQDLPP